MVQAAAVGANPLPAVLNKGKVLRRASLAEKKKKKKKKKKEMFYCMNFSQGSTKGYR